MLHRLIVTSEAYRRSTRVNEDMLRLDRNRLLARGPRHRLDAWDQDLALSVSGLLVDQLGGEPVRPTSLLGLGSGGYTGSNTAITKPSGDACTAALVHSRSAQPPLPNTKLFDAPDRETWFGATHEHLRWPPWCF